MIVKLSIKAENGLNIEIPFDVEKSDDNEVLSQVLILISRKVVKDLGKKDILDLMYSLPISEPAYRYERPYAQEEISERPPSEMTLKEKLFKLIIDRHAGEWFNSRILKEEYERVYGEKISINAVSTYLARFYEEGKLERRGNRARREYRLVNYSLSEQEV